MLTFDSTGLISTAKMNNSGRLVLINRLGILKPVLITSKARMVNARNMHEYTGT